MNLRPLYSLLLLSCLVELGACNALLKKKDPDPAPVATVPAVVATPAPTPQPTAPPVADPAAAAAPAPVAGIDETIVPAPQDFEDEATEKVTPANFRAQLSLLQADVK